MSAQHSYRKIDRQEVFQFLKAQIEKDPKKEVEVSTSHLADKFGVQGPTMDYHLNKLVEEEGLLEVSSRRGRYNRKIYRLTSKAKSQQPDSAVDGNVEDLVFNDPEAFKELLLRKMDEQDKSKNQEVIQEEPKTEVEVKEQPFEAEEKEVPGFVEESKVPEVLHTEPVSTFEQPKRQQAFEVKDLNLDDRIEKFIEQSKSVTTAEHLLTQQDREILSVMNESLQQQMVFFKDLTDQLSTREDKRLVQMLIDERNAMQEQMNHMKEEMALLIEQTKEAQSKNASIDPNRVRQMHQIIINTLDTYLEQPNHALALGRREFRKNMTKEISDLAKYVLNLVD